MKQRLPKREQHRPADRDDMPQAPRTDYDFTLKNDNDGLERLRLSLQQISADHNLPELPYKDFELAVYESVANIVMYAHDDTETHSISVRITLEPTAIAALITDDGKPFDPLQVPEPPAPTSLADATVSGRGIQLIRKLSDDLRYDRDGTLNHLRIVRNLR